MFDATIAIQAPDFTLSDFFCSWLKIQIRLQRKVKDAVCQTQLASVLLKNLNFRKIALLNHPAMLCAIYLDPRVYKELNDKEIMIAKTSLADLHEKIVELKSNPTDSSMNSVNDSLEEYFRQRDGSINNSNNVSDTRVEFMQTLDNFRSALQNNSLKRKQGKAAAPNDVFSIFEFWEKQKMLYPLLYQVASVIFAIPPSQATVERSFSALNYLFTNRRCGLKPSLLEDCLMIKLNADIAQAVNGRDLIEAEKEI